MEEGILNKRGLMEEGVLNCILCLCQMSGLLLICDMLSFYRQFSLKTL